MTEQLQNLVDTFVETFEKDPQDAEKVISKALMDMSAGDDEVYRGLRVEASKLVMAKLENNLREETAIEAVEAEVAALEEAETADAAE